jgi:predicted Ser/Thr protein kinase
MRLALGTRLGPYEILAPIGSGGMGEVYRARDTRLGRDVALKVLPEDLANDPSRRQRFEQEARAVAALNHPNIVAVFDVGEEYIVSELVDGEPLRGAKFGLRKILEIATQIASGLTAAHAGGIVHRDLKPDNILLTRDGRAKILDFGLARVRQPQSTPDQTVTVRTEAGVVMGTVGYMSPEQVRGLDADPRSDIFSFGVMLYEMLSGERAFRGETPVDTMQAILRHDPPDLPQTVPGGVRDVVSRCLEKDAANRFQSASDLGFVLQALARDDGRSGPTPAPIAAAPNWGKLWPAALVLAVIGTFLVTRWMALETLAPRWSAVRLGAPEIALNPRLSPDGRLLAFQAMVAENTQVAVMQPESDNWSVLTRSRGQGLIDFVCWSRDGAKIYFSRVSDVPRGVFSVPFLGGEESLVLEDASNPAVLPDGTLLVMRINQHRGKQLYRFWPDTGKLQDLPAEFAPVSSGLPLPLFASPDGKRAFVFGTIPGASQRKPSLIDVDLSASSSRPFPMETLAGSEVAAVTLSVDGKALIAALRSKSLGRIVSIPLEGRGGPRDLFTVTGDVHRLEAGADGSVLVNLWDRSAEVVSLPRTGGQPQRIAAFPHLPSNAVVALADGRAVVTVQSSGRSRLMAVAAGKDPAPLINTTEETSGPMTAVAGNRIAFAIGSAPRESIAIAAVSNGRIGARIAPVKGEIRSLAAAPDGETLYFTAAGSVWSIANGGEPRRICAGDGVGAHPSGSSLVVVRVESAQARLFEVPTAGGVEREIPVNPASRIFGSFSSGAIRADGQMLLALNPSDSWFNPLALLDLRSGQLARLAGDGVSDLPAGAWTRDGQIVATRLGLNASIWKFTPEGK